MNKSSRWLIPLYCATWSALCVVTIPFTATSASFCQRRHNREINTMFEIWFPAVNLLWPFEMKWCHKLLSFGTTSNDTHGLMVAHAWAARAASAGERTPSIIDRAHLIYARHGLPLGRNDDTVRELASCLIWTQKLPRCTSEIHADVQKRNCIV